MVNVRPARSGARHGSLSTTPDLDARCSESYLFGRQTFSYMSHSNDPHLPVGSECMSSTLFPGNLCSSSRCLIAQETISVHSRAGDTSRRKSAKARSPSRKAFGASVTALALTLIKASGVAAVQRMSFTFRCLEQIYIYIETPSAVFTYLLVFSISIIYHHGQYMGMVNILGLQSWNHLASH